MLLAAGLLFVDLGAGEWRTWDEGLYGRLSRNALEQGRYLYAIDESGAYYERFSKPPMSLWLTALSLRAFGMSVGALRIPFALGMLATVAFAFGWGRRIGGLPMAISWSAGLALCAATTRWGRHACIEPMFVAGLLGGLWAYHASVEAKDAKISRRNAVLAGVALAFAMLTKQLAVGLAVLPILVFEGWRRDRSALPRLAVALGIPLLAGVVWFAWAGIATDGGVFEVLLNRGVRQRMAGFEGGQNARTLNELAGVVSEATDPIPWPLGAAGLAVFCVLRPRAELRTPRPELLLPLWFVGNVLVFENLSQSMLPWYALHIVVPAIGGAAWLISATTRPPGRGTLRVVWAGLGWTGAGIVALTAASGVLSQLNVALFAIVLLVVAFARRAEATRITALLGVVLVMFAARLRDPELNPPAQPFSPLMEALADSPRVAVDRRAALPQLAYRALYGPGATEVSRAPWPTDSFDAYVVPTVLPTEYEPPQGVILHRAAGVSAFAGDLSTRAWSFSTLEALLRAGPITYEAEHLAAAGWDTALDDPEASGGSLRGYTRYRNELPPKLPLSIGPKLRLPKGHYVLEVWMRWSCPKAQAQQTAALLTVSTNTREIKRAELACEDGPDVLTPYRVEFTLPAPETFNTRLGFRNGTVEHDRSVLTWRAE